MRCRALALLPLGLALAGCAATAGAPTANASAGIPEEPLVIDAPEPLRSILTSTPALRAALRRAEERRIQVVLGMIETGLDGKPQLTQFAYRADAEYFYPASSVKTFAAVAALEGLSEIRAESGLAIDRDTPMVYYPLFEGESIEQEDPTHVANGKITVGHEIRKLALISDNESFNKLYEFVGQDGLARSLARAGLTAPRIVHRLSEFRSPEENLRSPRIDFVGSYFRQTIPERTAQPFADPPPPIPGLLVGRGYLAGDRRIDEPLDFSGKNRISLADLQRGLCKLVAPPTDCGGGAPFRLDDSDRSFLLAAMRELPRQSKDPLLDPAEYPDDYGKLFLPGLRAERPRVDWTLVNKTGEAYGFLTDNAWIENPATGRGLFLAATIYANSDGILNDDEYDYETVGKPFFVELGRAVAAYLVAADPPKNR
ncbi:MAG: serine hydrolase [Thermoanaerobaculia bacterium]